MILSQKILSELEGLAVEVAREAAACIQEMADNHLRLENKSGGSSIASQVLTEADLKAQQIIYRRMQGSMDQYDLGWLGEESPDDHSRRVKDYFWCVDPLDGTLPYTEAYPGYGVSIALINKAGKALIGVVCLPFSMQVWCSSSDGPTDIRDDARLHLFCDRSFLRHPFYTEIVNGLKAYVKFKGLQTLEIHSQAGAVVNAIGVMQNAHACYFKFPKPSDGGGSIWDYAATSAILRAKGRVVSDALGEPLQLNDPDTAYMNRKGVLYASDEELARWIRQIYGELYD